MGNKYFPIGNFDLSDLNEYGKIEDENGYRLDAITWDWDPMLSDKTRQFVDYYDPTEYIVLITGSLKSKKRPTEFSITVPCIFLGCCRIWNLTKPWLFGSFVLLSGSRILSKVY